MGSKDKRLHQLEEAAASMVQGSLSESTRQCGDPSCACAHDPKLEVVIEMLRKSLQGEDWERRIDLAHSASQQIGCGCVISGSE